jgi:F-type H+-transporting ATPase subunit delta
MKDTVAAGKYARALFAEAQAKNQVLACQQGLEEVSRIIRVRESLQRILVQPFITQGEKQKLIHSTLGEYATPLLERFLQMLVERDRFALLSVIVDEFQAEVDRAQNVQPLKVRVAYPMNEAQQKTLQTKLEAWLKSKVRMEVAVEPELIGGLIIQTRDHELDQSVRTKLKKLKEAMSQ